MNVECLVDGALRATLAHSLMSEKAVRNWRNLGQSLLPWVNPFIFCCQVDKLRKLRRPTLTTACYCVCSNWNNDAKKLTCIWYALLSRGILKVCTLNYAVWRERQCDHIVCCWSTIQSKRRMRALHRYMRFDVADGLQKKPKSVHQMFSALHFRGKEPSMS